MSTRTGKIRVVEDKNGEAVFPVTHEKAVMDSSGVKLSNKISMLSQDVASIKELLSGNFRLSLINMMKHVAFIDEYGQSYINAVDVALSGIPQNVVSITATYTQTTTVYPFTELNALKSDLVIIGTLENSDTLLIPTSSVTLSGTLAVGTSTVSVYYEALSTTFDVTVTQGERLRLTDGDFYVNNSAIDLVAATGDIVFSTVGNGSGGKRNGAVSAYNVGVKHLTSTSDGINYTETNYYPIPIPNWATRIVVSAINSTNNIRTGPAFYTYDSSTDMYSRDRDAGWGTGERVFTSTAGQYEYLTVALSLASGVVQNYPATEITVIFQ